MSDGDMEASFLEGLTLSPDWAKKSSDSQQANFNTYTSRDDRDSRDSRPSRGGSRYDRGHDEGRGSREERRPRPQGRDERPGFVDPRRELPSVPVAASPRREFSAPQRSFEDRPPRPEFRPYDRTPPPPVPFEIRFLPDQKALSVIAHKVQGGHRAIPLRDLVKLFFDNPDSTEVRLEFDAENKDKRFHQCGKCGWFALSEDEVRAHAITAHFSEFFDSEEITVDPPSGNFTSVARCGFTGKLLAPPNHHSYNKKILWMLRTECAGKSEEAYRSRIELVNTPEAIEQWKQESSKQTVYFLKPQTEPKKKGEQKKPTEVVPEGDSIQTAEPEQDTGQPQVQKMSLEEAEDFFSRSMLPKMLRSERQVTSTHTTAKTITDPSLVNAISRAWDREQTIQTASLFFAVRGGLRSRKLSLFRASNPRREEFVMHKAPTPLGTTATVPELTKIIDYITEHPGCTKTEMLADLIQADSAPEAAEGILKQIAFVTERAYVIEYFNGVLALAAEHPFYADPAKRNAKDQRKKADKPAPKTEKPVASEKTQAAEEVPVVLAEQGVVETPAPVVTASAPVVEESVPAVEALAPVVEESAPVVETPAPVTEESEPAKDAE